MYADQSCRGEKERNEERMIQSRTGIRLLFVTGFLCCCLPLLLHLYNEKEQQKAVATYQKTVKEKKDTSAEERKEAEDYNSLLFQTQGLQVEGKDKEKLSEASYGKLLNPTETGIMGSLDIPKIGAELPIYHGTEEEVLSKGIGHLPGSSLPVGGKSTHSVLTGHRGLPQSKLLTRLDEMEKGDYFFLHVQGETMAYKVTGIQVVKPEEIEVLEIQEGEDLCSIITCTPYGINTHRLIVTGERIPYEAKKAATMEEALPSTREVLFTMLPMAWLLILFGYVWKERRKKDETPDKI